MHDFSGIRQMPALSATCIVSIKEWIAVCT